MSLDAHIFSFPVTGGTTTGALGTIPLVGTAMLFKAPEDANGGGITVREVYLTSQGVGNGTFQLFSVPGSTPGTGGTKNGTITSSFGTSTIAAGTAYSFTISDGWVNGGDWVYLAKTGSLVYPGGNLTIVYQMGR